MTELELALESEPEAELTQVSNIRIQAPKRLEGSDPLGEDEEKVLLSVFV